MSAAVHAPASVQTATDVVSVGWADQALQPYVSRPSTEAGREAAEAGTLSVAQLTTHYHGVAFVPTVVAHSTPSTVMVHLHAATVRENISEVMQDTYVALLR